jgi:uncharacterized protein (DUF1015 family)
MAAIRPLQAIRYDPERVDLGRVLSPPYDVISDEARRLLYAGDAHNIVRIDYGEGREGDVDGAEDRYTRGRAELDAWLAQGVLRRDPAPALYILDHEYRGADGKQRTRRGIFTRVRALPWESSDVLPHERTLRGPKEDRLRLMRATGMQTSAVFCLWDAAPGLDEMLAEATEGAPAAGAEIPGEVDRESLRLWVADDPAAIAGATEALAAARLYIADGHHRFETAAAYAAERRAAAPVVDPAAGYEWTLVYLCAAGDPAMEILPTHRLVLPAPGIPDSIAELTARIGDRLDARPQPDADTALAAAARLAGTHNAITVVARDGVALLSAPRQPPASPRARLDVSVAQEVVLGIGCGLDADRIAGGALGYTRSAGEAEAEVASGRAALAVCLLGCTAAEIIDVSLAGEQMPQKSTYFYPKVPTGLVLSPL